MNRSDVIEILKKRQDGRTLTDLAQELKVSSAYLSDVYSGNRNPGRKLLKALGLQKEVHFVRNNK